MLDQAQVIAMMKESMASLVQSGLIPVPIEINGDTVVFGGSSPLDSISFVTLIMDVEERMQRATARDDLAIDLTEIDDFSVDDPNLTASRLADFLVRLGSASPGENENGDKPPASAPSRG